MSSPIPRENNGPLGSNAPANSTSLDASRFQQSGYAALVAEMLVEMIAQGTFQPGERLNEVALADQLQISRSPVREALKLLSGQGLVRMIPGRGAFVQSYDASVLRELGELREVVECRAAALACERVTPAELRAAEEAMHSARAELFRDDLPAHHARLATDFHQIVAQACHNSEIESLIRTIETKVTIARYRSGASLERARQAHEEHERILEAIRVGDQDRAVAEMRGHLELSLANMLNTLS